jgi:hypothetical protein
MHSLVVVKPTISTTYDWSKPALHRGVGHILRYASTRPPLRS